MKAFSLQFLVHLLVYPRNSNLLLNYIDVEYDANWSCRVTLCKVEFYQPFYWLYSMPNLLVLQQLVTLYLGGILVRVVSEIV